MSSTSQNYPGYLYILHNECYKYYGKDFFKLGRTKDPRQRMNGYRTPFVDKSKFLYVSATIFEDSIAAEFILFSILNSYRIHPKREFFNCSVQLAVDAIQMIEVLPSDEISVIYDKLKHTAFTNYYIKKYFSKLPVEYDFQHSKTDDFFQQFMFKPRNAHKKEEKDPSPFQRDPLSFQKDISYDEIELALDKIVNE